MSNAYRSARGFAPTLGYVRDMANQLLAVRDGGQVGEKWASNLVRRKSQPETDQGLLCFMSDDWARHRARESSIVMIFGV